MIVLSPLLINSHCYSTDLKIIVIPECLCRESSVFIEIKVAGSPIQAFGDDEWIAC